MEGTESRPEGGADQAGARAWWREGFLPADSSPQALLEMLFALEPAGAWRRVRGRETFPWPERLELVVKRYQGGEARDWWYERLREGEAPRSPGRREAENLRALERDRLSAPRVVAWVEEDVARRHPGRAGKRGRSALVMERVPIVASLRQALARAGERERERLGLALLDLVARLHTRGWYHRDLYLEHVVLDADGGLWLLDLGRARREEAPRERWFVKDLAALYSSAPGSIAPRARLRFLRGWLARRRAAAPAQVRDKHELRRWSRVIQAKGRRLAQHAPRFADDQGAARTADAACNSPEPGATGP